MKYLTKEDLIQIQHSDAPVATRKTAGGFLMLIEAIEIENGQNNLVAYINADKQHKVGTIPEALAEGTEIEKAKYPQADDLTYPMRSIVNHIENATQWDGITASELASEHGISESDVLNCIEDAKLFGAELYFTHGEKPHWYSGDLATFKARIKERERISDLYGRMAKIKTPLQ